MEEPAAKRRRMDKAVAWKRDKGRLFAVTIWSRGDLRGLRDKFGADERIGGNQGDTRSLPIMITAAHDADEAAGGRVPS